MDILVSLQPFVLHIALFASLLQLSAYIVYIYTSDIEPEPLAWFMWGSTTWIIALMEADSMILARSGWANVTSGEKALLVLPILCGCVSALIAFKCWRKGKISWPTEWQGQIAVVLGTGFSVLYIFALFLLRTGQIANDQHENIVFWLLVMLSSVTIIEFTPIIRNTIKNPDDEKPVPWVIWTLAYVLLSCATYLETGITSLLVYPLLNVLLHSTMIMFASREGKTNPVA